MTASLAVLALLFSIPALVPNAAAYEYGRGHGSDWVFAAGIRLGGFHLSIGYQPVRYGTPTYYYRTNDSVHYDGYQCTDRCFRRSRTYYHHERCPVMLHLMHVARVHPHRLFRSHAPRYDNRWVRYDPYDWHRGYGGSRYDDRRHYDYDRRDQRYDRRDRHHDRRDRRNRGRGRGRGHGRHD